MVSEGPGGFRGGDGAYRLVNFANVGGTGLGPGGGAGGIDHHFANGHGAGGTFLGAPDLLPLVGGSGGGGGASTTITSGCAGGGGGGAAGALLIAVNGTLTIDGQIVADGGNSGSYGHPSCASTGGGGSGGAVRLLATTINGVGNAFARAGSGGSVPAQPGSIRLEALNNNLTVGQTTPLATRAAGPGPIVNPITPTVAITTVGGQAVPSPPSGGTGAIDLVLSAPGQTAIGVATAGVPNGTIVNLTVKPRVGGVVVTTPVTLGNCDVNGACAESVTFDLPAGAYFIEARGHVHETVRSKTLNGASMWNLEPGTLNLNPERGTRNPEPTEWRLPLCPRAWIWVLLFVVPAVPASASDGRPLPAFTVVSQAGASVSSAALSTESRWLLIYVSPNCGSCDRLLRTLKEWQLPQLTGRLVVIVRGSLADATAYVAGPLGLEGASLSWYADAGGEGAGALELRGAPVLAGVEHGHITWRLGGVLNDPKALESVVRGWVEY